MNATTVRRVAVSLAVAWMAGCSAPTASVQESDAPDPTEAPTFDVAAVVGSFTDECTDPIIVDDIFCEQVQLDELYAEGTILYVPTTLAADARDRAQVICDQVATAHFDGEGNDLGFTHVGILDRDGGNAAACSV